LAGSKRKRELYRKREKGLSGIPIEDTSTTFFQERDPRGAARPEGQSTQNYYHRKIRTQTRYKNRDTKNNVTTAEVPETVAGKAGGGGEPKG